MSESDVSGAFVVFVRTKATNASEQPKCDMLIWNRFAFALRLFRIVTKAGKNKPVSGVDS
jgi:hypothetical protein